MEDPTGNRGKTGFVYLVGAGPGDPQLITLRGKRCLETADTILYDRLANPSLLKFCRDDAEIIYVGKEPSRHPLTQSDINALMIQRAISGQVVCRLKGGDPFVFGRGSEEGLACAEAGIPFAIVPGVSSAIAVPAYAGIPVTHREISASLLIISGHSSKERSDSDIQELAHIDWSSIAHSAETLVFLMGVKSLPGIAKNLIQAGRDAGTPIAVIQQGTVPEQKTLVSTLGEVEEEVERVSLKPPAVIVVGEVVLLREKIRWFERRPLFGKRVLVTRSGDQADSLSGRLEEAGAISIEYPVVQIRFPDDNPLLDQALQSNAPHPYDWIIFSSVNAVRAVRERMRTLRLDARIFRGSRIAAIGSSTAKSLQDLGILADYIPMRFVSESVIENWPETDLKGKRILIPCARAGRKILQEWMISREAVVEDIVAYETLPNRERADEICSRLLSKEIDIITFTSSSTVHSLYDTLSEGKALDSLTGVTLACIGPTTAQSLQERGLIPDLVAEEHTIPGLIAALESYFISRSD